MGSQHGRVQQVDFWFDPVCPYSWIGSRWLLEVTTQRRLQIKWHVMSLYLLNEHRTDDPSYVSHLREVNGAARVATAAAGHAGEPVLGDLYTAFGARIFDDWRYAGGDECRAAMAAALAEVGLPADLVAAFDTEEHDAELRRSHDAAIALVGDECGTPVTRIDDPALYGPILNSIPRGAAAVRVFDAMRLLSTVPDFYELKRTRTTAPVFT
ncbi:MAG TPA: DsbA family protein [Intrasporangium sp.]|uniref:DsbA family protein n=1 Tax=Intrasporangium sp. TaxID=1925024 RepID=UPI002F932582